MQSQGTLIKMPSLLKHTRRYLLAEVCLGGTGENKESSKKKVIDVNSPKKIYYKDNFYYVYVYLPYAKQP